MTNVYILTVTTKHGTDIDPFTTPALALAAGAAFARSDWRDWWPDAPESDGEVVDAYNEHAEMAGEISIEEREVIDGRIDKCPQCGGPLETFLRIDLDDVVVAHVDPQRDHPVLIDFEIAHSANDKHTGLVVEEARVTCAECGYEVDAAVPPEIMRHWSFER